MIFDYGRNGMIIFAFKKIIQIDCIGWGAERMRMEQ